MLSRQSLKAARVRGAGAVLLACVFMAACGQASPSADDGGGRGQPTPQAPQASVTSARWQPPPVPVPSDPGLRDRLGRYAELILGQDGTVANGSPEHLAYLETCYESAGFELEVEDGGLTGQFGSQRSWFERVRDACEQAAVDSGLVRAQEPLDDQFLAAQFDAFMLTYDCLVREGYPVAAPPSKDAYIESGGMNWHPYARLGGAGDISIIEAKCPQDVVILFEMLASGTRP